MKFLRARFANVRRRTNEGAKSDVGQPNGQSPTSDKLGNGHAQIFSVPVEVPRVPLRDLARYAGRVVRAAARTKGPVLITERGRALALLVPVAAHDAHTPGPLFADLGLARPDEEPEEPEVPADLPDDERAVLAVFGSDPLSIEAVRKATGLDFGPLGLALTHLEIKGFLRRDWLGTYERRPR